MNFIKSAEEFYTELENNFEIRYFNIKGQEIVVKENQIEMLVEFRVDGEFDSEYGDADEAYKYYLDTLDQRNYLLIE